MGVMAVANWHWMCMEHQHQKQKHRDHDSSQETSKSSRHFQHQISKMPSSMRIYIFYYTEAEMRTSVRESSPRTVIYACHTVFNTNCLDYTKYARMNVNEEKNETEIVFEMPSFNVKRIKIAQSATKQTHEIQNASERVRQLSASYMWILPILSEGIDVLFISRKIQHV